MVEPVVARSPPPLMNDPQPFVFDHERLDVYRAAVEAARRIRAARWPRRSAHIRDQAVRASESIVLNIAEGVGRGPGDARRNHHRIAFGSTAEARAALDVVDLPEEQMIPIDRLLRRIGAMLARMAR